MSSELMSSGLGEIYSSHWLDMENSYLEAGEKVNKNLLERFFVDFMTIQNNGIIPSREDLFINFVEFYRTAEKFQKKDLIIKNLMRYSVYYLKILFAKLTDDEIRLRIKKINAYDATDSYPFLMEVFEDYENANINRTMFLEILDTVINFIEARNSAKPSQVALSFAGLSTEINKMLVLKDYMPKFVVDVEEFPEKSTINSKYLS